MSPKGKSKANLDTTAPAWQSRRQAPLMKHRSITLATAILAVIAPAFHASADDRQPASAAETAVPPLTAAQREAIRTVIEDGACATIIATGDAELQERLMGENNINYTQIKISSIASRAMADSPAAAMLPPALRNTFRQTAEITEQLSDAFENKPVDNERITTLIEQLKEVNDRQKQYCKQAGAFDVEQMAAAISARLTTAFQNEFAKTKNRKGIWNSVKYDRKKREAYLHDMLNRLRQNLRAEQQPAPTASPEEKQAISDFLDRVFINTNLSILKHPEQWEDRSEHMARIQHLTPDASSLPEKLRQQIERERQAYSSVIRLRNKQRLNRLIASLPSMQDISVNDEQAFRDSMDHAVQQSRTVQTLIRTLTGISPEEHHAGLAMKLRTQAQEKIPEALSRLNLPPLHGSAIPSYLLNLSLKEQERIMTTAGIIVLEDWQKNGSPR